MSKISKKDERHLIESELLKKENFEAKQNLVGFFHLLYKIDRRINPHLYENNGNTNNPDKSPERLSSDWERSFR